MLEGHKNNAGMCDAKKGCTDSVFKMKNMIRVRNSKNTWRVRCVGIIVSIEYFLGDLIVDRISLEDLPGCSSMTVWPTS